MKLIFKVIAKLSVLHNKLTIYAIPSILITAHL